MFYEDLWGPVIALSLPTKDFLTLLILEEVMVDGESTLMDVSFGMKLREQFILPLTMMGRFRQQATSVMH